GDGGVVLGAPRGVLVEEEMEQVVAVECDQRGQPDEVDAHLAGPALDALRVGPRRIGLHASVAPATLLGCVSAHCTGGAAGDARPIRTEWGTPTQLPYMPALHAMNSSKKPAREKQMAETTLDIRKRNTANSVRSLSMRHSTTTANRGTPQQTKPFKIGFFSGS